MSTSVSTSSWNPVVADTGTTSAQSPSSATAASWAATRSGGARSVLVTMPTTGAPLITASSAARYLSPGPMRSGAGRQNPITSTSVSVERTRLSSRSPSSVRGLCRPGVSTRMSCASGRCTMPRITRRVVCGRSLVIATLAPTRALVRVDLPTFGRPTRHAKPERNTAVTCCWLILRLSRMPVTVTVIGMDQTPIWRPTARLLLHDPLGRLLLFSALDPAGETWWFTPGGGVRRGETLTAAAVRELAEETGYVCTEAQLGPVVATCAGIWAVPADDGRRYFAADSFFLLKVPEPVVDTGGQEELERS